MSQFAVVLVPADDAQLMEELSLDAADVEEQVSMVTTYAKAHFEKIKAIASLSDAERAAQHSKMRTAVQKNHPGAVVSDEQMAMLSMMNLVDTVPLQGADRVVVFFHCFIPLFSRSPRVGCMIVKHSHCSCEFLCAHDMPICSHTVNKPHMICKYALPQ